MKEEYVTYKQSVALKRLEFKEEVTHYYCHFKSDGEIKLWSCNPPDNHNARLSINEVCSAPRLDQAQKWLREKGIHISVNPYMGYDVDADGALYNEYPSWSFELMDVASADFMDDAGGNHTSYELALSSGIDKALELLTDKLNDK